MVWTVIHVAPSKATAEELQKALAEKGLLVSLRTTGLATNGGVGHVELITSKREARAVHSALHQWLGRSRLRK